MLVYERDTPKVEGLKLILQDSVSVDMNSNNNNNNKDADAGTINQNA